MGDKDPKSMEKLKDQADEKKEAALEYKHETPAHKQQDNERDDVAEQAKVDQQYGEEPKPAQTHG
ncbi:MAG TPA: hypothetical protein VGE04_19275 [Chloroflexia bacterium]